MTAKKENRGGKRKGAGRKMLLELAGESRTKIIQDFQRIAEENGSSVGEELGKLVFGKRKEKRLKMQAIQLYVRDVLPKISEPQVNETKILKPEIYLPELLPDSDEAPDYEVPDSKPH